MSIKDRAATAVQAELDRKAAQEAQTTQRLVDTVRTAIEKFGERYELEISDVDVSYSPPHSYETESGTQWTEPSASGWFTAGDYPMAANYLWDLRIGYSVHIGIRGAGGTTIRSLADFGRAIAEYEAGLSKPDTQAEPSPSRHGRRRRGRR